RRLARPVVGLGHCRRSPRVEAGVPSRCGCQSGGRVGRRRDRSVAGHCRCSTRGGAQLCTAANAGRVLVRHELGVARHQARDGAGGRYVDVAVMAPVEQALSVPLLVAGPAAADALVLLKRLGFTNVRCVGEEVGRASAIKMIRSVMVKGLEALSLECATAAEAAGVLDEVTASLDASEKPLGWSDRFAYNRERMETHGLRRAAEMEESAKTLQGLGVEPVMTRGTIVLQRRTAKSR